MSLRNEPSHLDSMLS